VVGAEGVGGFCLEYMRYGMTIVVGWGGLVVLVSWFCGLVVLVLFSLVWFCGWCGVCFGGLGCGVSCCGSCWCGWGVV